MTRKQAQDRHRDTEPTDDRWPPTGTALVDALVAFHHPTRRRLYEVLRAHGPASVGRLTELTGLAAGSVSHHLKPLHRAGFVTPAPELARDTRESWWRAEHRSLVWGSEDFEPGSAARTVGEVAERSSFELGDLTLMPVMTPLLGVIVAATSVLTGTATYGLAMAGLCLALASRPAIRALA